MSYISDLISHVTAKRGNVSEEITSRWQNNSLGHAPNKYVPWPIYVMKFWIAKHCLTKNFAFLETFAINI